MTHSCIPLFSLNHVIWPVRQWILTCLTYNFKNLPKGENILVEHKQHPMLYVWFRLVGKVCVCVHWKKVALKLCTAGNNILQSYNSRGHLFSIYQWWWYLLNRNRTTLKWVSFLYFYPWLRVEVEMGGRDLQRFPCALDLKVSVSVNFTSNGRVLLVALWSGMGGYHYWIQDLCLNMFRFKMDSAETSQLKVYREWQDQGWG